jgi:hypothetical protein
MDVATFNAFVLMVPLTTLSTLHHGAVRWRSADAVVAAVLVAVAEDERFHRRNPNDEIPQCGTKPEFRNSGDLAKGAIIRF